MKWRFALKFLITFAALIVLWWQVDFGAIYTRIVLALAAVVSPLANGWLLEVAASGAAAFRRGTERMDLLIQLPALSMGLMPLLSLIVATPGQKPLLLARNLVLGIVLYILIDVAIVLVYPYILDRPNTWKDTLGVFSGLVGFVVAPLGLWFVLTYSALRPIWQLVAVEMEVDRSKRSVAPKRQGVRAR
ncbi:MAG TPA: hypothetical protein VEB21_09260 [Terriglobales bacterium]|nr:hypothetical protein [Terriglobales bacterium]